MYRIIFLIAVSLALISCRGNDKVVSGWEINDVYHSTIITPNPTTGEKVYQGPPINTMDAANTYEMYSLRSTKSKEGAVSYELLVQLTYYSKWRYYDAATVRNKPTSSFKVVSREAGLCEQAGCMFKELLAIQLSDAFIKENMSGFELSISSKSGLTSVLFVPSQYLKGYLKAVEGKNY